MKIHVRSVPETFRRAGRIFTRTAVEIDVDDATAAILKGEPMLVVEEAPRAVSAPEEGKDDPAASTEDGPAESSRPAQAAKGKKKPGG